MKHIASALADQARWRILELLAQRPRSVGEVAELTGARQPQTTKQLQALARAGLVTVYPLGQRRVYALETAPLASLQQRLGELIEAAQAHGNERDVVARYSAAIAAQTAVADRSRWADGRVFGFERLLAAPRELVWRHWVEAPLLETWWGPPSMHLSECILDPQADSRAVLEYRDAEGRSYRAEGRVHAANRPEHLAFTLSVLDRAGAVSFTGHYDLHLEQAAQGRTRLRLDLRITDTAVEAVPYIAGIETGWGQVLDQLEQAVATVQRGGGKPVRKTIAQGAQRP